MCCVRVAHKHEKVKKTIYINNIYSLKLKNEYIDELLIISQLNRVANSLTDIDEKAKNQIINTDSKIRELPRYKYIKSEYEKAYQIFLNKTLIQS